MRDSFQFQGEKLRGVKRACEPTDLMWENTEVTPKERKARTYAMICVIILLCLGYFVFAVVAIQHQLFIGYVLSPPGVDCGALLKHHEPQALANMAYAEEYVLDAAHAAVDPFGGGLLPDLNGQTSRTGALTCFCREQFKAGKTGESFFDVQESDGQSIRYQVCKEYAAITSTVGLGTLMNLCFAYVVVIANYVARVLFIWFASLIRFTTHSQQTNFIMLSVFWMQFFNSGLLFVFAPWDSRGAWGLKIPYWDKVFDGVYPDYNANWFSDVGVTVCAALFSNMFWPLIEFWAFFAMRTLFRMADQCALVPNKFTKTSNRTLQAFQEMYSGPAFVIHYKYSFVMNVSFCAFLFGPGMPILFPIAWFAVFLQYTMERLMMAYSYRKPVMYDSEINRNCLRMLSFGPVVYIFSAAWTFSN